MSSKILVINPTGTFGFFGGSITAGLAVYALVRRVRQRLFVSGRQGIFTEQFDVDKLVAGSHKRPWSFLLAKAVNSEAFFA
jgi:hypothetical protein